MGRVYPLRSRERAPRVVAERRVPTASPKLLPAAGLLARTPRWQISAELCTARQTRLLINEKSYNEPASDFSPLMWGGAWYWSCRDSN